MTTEQLKVQDEFLTVDKLHKLFRIALHDVEALHNAKEFKGIPVTFNMNSWLYWENEDGVRIEQDGEFKGEPARCAVCLAGASLLSRKEGVATAHIGLWDFIQFVDNIPLEWRSRMQAVDYCRQVSFLNAARCLHLNLDIPSYMPLVDIKDEVKWLVQAAQLEVKGWWFSAMRDDDAMPAFISAGHEIANLLEKYDL